ncbi:MAG: hypothetical protein U1A77_00490 [Pirellulales bacterium]
MTDNGAAVGDLHMSLIQTCESNEINPFDYLQELHRNAAQAALTPEARLPWNYRETLATATDRTAAVPTASPCRVSLAASRRASSRVLPSTPSSCEKLQACRRDTTFEDDPWRATLAINNTYP